MSLSYLAYGLEQSAMMDAVGQYRTTDVTRKKHCIVVTYVDGNTKKYIILEVVQGSFGWKDLVSLLPKAPALPPWDQKVSKSPTHVDL